MTAVLIPPSPQPEPTPVSGSGSGSKAAAAATGENNANARANAQPYMYSDEPSKKILAMVHKIQSGTEEITPQDISELDAAIELHQKSKSAAAASASIEIPLVDKDYLKSCPSNPNVLVRYIGMVQDMLDPEYYATKVNGIHTKYREFFYREPENNNGNVNGHGLENGHGYGHDEFAMSQYLEERQPLVLVPIPNSTQLLRTSIQTMYANNNTNNNGENVNEERMDDTKYMDTNNRGRDRDRDDGSSGRKRPLESTMNHSGSEAAASRNPRLNPPQPATASENINANADSADNAGERCGWWPEGCMKSDPNHNPVLAKLYYDDDVHEHEHEHENGHSQAQGQGQNKPRLQLNDIVEVYGILSLDPHGASFHDQKQRNPITSGNGNCNGSTNGNGIGEISNDQYLAQQEGFFHDFVNPIAIPPPSLLPRLHVLKYNTLNLDDLIFDAVSGSGDGNGNGNGNEELALTSALEGGMKSEGKENVNSDSDSDSDSERQLLIDTFAKYVFEGDKTASEALLMALLSAAERDHRYGNKAIQMPSGATLGCGSINFVLSDRESCNKLQERLRDVLTMIAPVVASVNLSLSALIGLEMNINMNSNESITSPGKNASNRLGPSVLQLPRASCLLINQAKLLEGRVNHSGERALTSLKKITTTHTVPYQFDQMEIDFEADHRVIVISSNERSANGEVGSKLLPCSMTIKLNLQGMAQDSTMDDIIPPAVISRIRRYISKCRSPHKSVAMPKVMLERSQNDFIKWRKNGLPGFGRDIEEHDFHRWLLLTRLQARSRNGAFKADLKDWENAVRLDGDMKA